MLQKYCACVRAHCSLLLLVLTGVFLESITEFVTDARAIDQRGEGKVKAIIQTPSGLHLHDSPFSFLYTIHARRMSDVLVQCIGLCSTDTCTRDAFDGMAMRFISALCIIM